MRRIILIIFASLMFVNTGFAGIDRIDYETIRLDWSTVQVGTVCVDGHKFVVSAVNEATSIVQAFEERDGKSLPAPCY